MTDTIVGAEPSKPEFRDSLRSFGPAGIVAFLLIVAAALVFMPIAAVLILLWLWLSKTPAADVGLARPSSWIGGLVIGIALGIALKLLLKAVILPVLGAQPENATFHYIAGNPSEAMQFAAYAIFGAGFAEELFFRGYLFERAKKLFGDGAFVSLLTLVVVTALFGVAHWQQGVFGIVNATVTGLVVGIVYLIDGRRLWTIIVAHATFDLAALAMIYYGLETQVAHLVFK